MNSNYSDDFRDPVRLRQGNDGSSVTASELALLPPRELYGNVGLRPQRFGRSEKQMSEISDLRDGVDFWEPGYLAIRHQHLVGSREP